MKNQDKTKLNIVSFTNLLVEDYENMKDDKTSVSKMLASVKLSNSIIAGLSLKLKYDKHMGKRSTISYLEDNSEDIIITK